MSHQSLRSCLFHRFLHPPFRVPPHENSSEVRQLFSMPRFLTPATPLGIFCYRYAQAVTLKRRKQTALCSGCSHSCSGRYAKRTQTVCDLPVVDRHIYLEFERWHVNCPRWSDVDVEHLDWMVKNPRHTKRFVPHAGKMRRGMPNKAAAEMERLRHGMAKDLKNLYMQQQVERTGKLALLATGIDEISIRKDHNYPVIVSDLERDHPIWVSGEGRNEAGLDRFFSDLGPDKAACIELTMMDT